MVLFFEKLPQQNRSKFFKRPSGDRIFSVRSTFYDGIKPVSKYSLCGQTRHQMKAYSLMISDFAAMYCLLVPVYPRIGQSLTDFRSLRKMRTGESPNFKQYFPRLKVTLIKMATSNPIIVPTNSHPLRLN